MTNMQLIRIGSSGGRNVYGCSVKMPPVSRVLSLGFDFELDGSSCSGVREPSAVSMASTSEASLGFLASIGCKDSSASLFLFYRLSEIACESVTE